MISETCTCGARLYEDSRFCHRCGRALRESDAELNLSAVAAAPAAIAPEVTPLPGEERPMGFGNPLAVQTAKLVAPAIILLSILPIVSALSAFASSWLGVLLYRRRTGNALSASNGAKLGWVIGSINFAVSLVILTLEFLTIEHDELIKAMTKFSPEMESVLRDPANFAMVMVAVLVFMFLYSVGTGIAGGALGAKLSSKDERRVV